MRSYRLRLSLSVVFFGVVQVDSFLQWRQQQGQKILSTSKTSRRKGMPLVEDKMCPRSFTRFISNRYVSMHNHQSNDSSKTQRQDFYAILGVSPHASSDEIKRSYRRLAKKYHPDSNPDYDTTDIFQQLNRAYEVLSTPFLKNKYDMFGPQGMGTSAASDSDNVRSGSSSTSRTNGDSNGIHSNPADIFSGYSDAPMDATPASAGFGTSEYSRKSDGTSSSPGSGAGAVHASGSPQARASQQQNFNRQKPHQNHRYHGRSKKLVGEDLHLNIEIDFERAIFGGREKVWIKQMETCQHCTGSGVKPGSEVNYCETCGGAGFMVQIERTQAGVLQSQTPCPTCKGSGKRVEEYCEYCNGVGTVEKSKLVEFTVPAGIQGHTRLRVRNEGNAGPRGGPSGDLFLFLKVKEHERFRREGSSIHSNHTIDYIDAILGNTVLTPVVGNKSESLQIPEGTEHNDVLCLTGQGARSLVGSPGARGDLLVTMKVKIPTEVNEEEEEILLRLRELEKKRLLEIQGSSQKIKQKYSEVEKPLPDPSEGTESNKESGIDSVTIIDSETIRINEFEVTYVSDQQAPANATMSASPSSSHTTTTSKARKQSQPSPSEFFEDQEGIDQLREMKRILCIDDEVAPKRNHYSKTPPPPPPYRAPETDLGQSTMAATGSAVPLTESPTQSTSEEQSYAPQSKERTPTSTWSSLSSPYFSDPIEEDQIPEYPINGDISDETDEDFGDEKMHSFAWDDVLPPGDENDFGGTGRYESYPAATTDDGGFGGTRRYQRHPAATAEETYVRRRSPEPYLDNNGHQYEDILFSVFKL